jgi:hypothetical protein
MACLENTFCSNSVNTPCLANSYSPAQSTSASACVCGPGYSGPNGGVCVECVANTFCVGGNTPPQNCPSLYSTSRKASSSASDCICMAGYFGPPGGTCSLCTEGSYCTGDGTKTECPGNTNSVYSPPGSVSVAGCVCNSGYYLKDVLVGETSVSECTVCEPGTYKTSPGNQICTSCNVGTFGLLSGAVSAGVCEDCPSFTTSNAGSGSKLNCFCLKGYTAIANGIACTGCVQGSFKPTDGIGSCTNCPESSYSLTQNASTPLACLACPQSTVSPFGSDALLDCICIAGYTAASNGVSCNACIAGTYKPLTGVGDCTKCPVKTYSNITASNDISFCKQCITNTNSVEGTTNANGCICDPGYSGNHGGPCLSCGIGTWCYGGELHDCTATNPFMTSAAQSGSVQDCKCGPGSTTYNINSCAACPAGSYCPGNDVIHLCPQDSTSDAQSTSITDCACDGGYQGSLGGPCTRCIENTFCSGGIMDYCPVNSYSLTGSSVKESCSCRAGFFGPNGGNCAICTPNAYCLGGETATPCSDVKSISPAGSNSSAACICQEGYYGDPNGVCTVCPVGSWCYGGVRNDCPVFSTTLAEGNFAITSCLCEKGYTFASQGACKACDPGEYKTSIGQEACTACGAGTYSSSRAATLATTCLPCPSNTFSIAHTESEVACFCNLGYTGIGGIFCTACVAGTFKEFTGSADCTPCPAKTYSTAVGATSSSTCQDCSFYSNSFSGSATPSDCICQGGYHNPSIMAMPAPHH